MSTDILKSIDERLAELNAEIDVLTAARIALTGETPKPPKGGRKATPQQEDALKKAREAKAAKAKANGKSTSKHDEIAAMLAQGMKPTAIAKALGISPGYVYNVRHQEAAKEAAAA